MNLIQNPSGKSLWITAFAVIVTLTALPDASWAAPPPHAPAHGWRQKHDPYYLGYTGKRWDKDYGIGAGRCDRSAVGVVVGGAIGAAVGSQIGSGSGRTIAILVGTVIGSVLGAELAQNMAAADQACLAHGLELGQAGRRINWDAPDTGLHYTLIPRDTYRNDRNCRNFTLITDGRFRSNRDGVGCRRPDGSWELRGI